MLGLVACRTADRQAPLFVSVLLLVAFAAGCVGTDSGAAAPTDGSTTAVDDAESLSAADTTNSPADTPSTAAPLITAPPTTAPSTTAPPITRPSWLGQRTLATGPNGFAEAQPTPPELQNRALPTIDTLPPPAGTRFISTIGPLEGEPLERSTWTEGCPVPPEELRYITVSFWGFDGGHHTGELIVHVEEAAGVVAVFAALHDQRFPIEEMRIVTDDDLTAPPTGDGNNTASFVCRAVTGGPRFSEHAYGLAIDINPFHNPYQRDALVLPELASSFLDRTTLGPGMIGPDSAAVTEFGLIGWEWGGHWSSLKDYQHFARNNR